MSRENFLKTTEGKAYEVLLAHNLYQDYGEIFIFRDIEGQYYMAIEGQPDRGAPYYDAWEIEASDYEAFLEPNLSSLKNLLSKRFFNDALWEYFIQKPENKAVLEALIADKEVFSVENYAPKIWLAKKRQFKKEEDLFTEATIVGDIILSDSLQATCFKSDTCLELDVFSMNLEKKAYELYRHQLRLPSLELNAGTVIEFDQGFPFFTFAKAYPIEPLRFGAQGQYLAEVLNGDGLGKCKKIVISKAGKQIFEFDHPNESGLGLFWAFEEAAADSPLKNALLFMYSLRDHRTNTDYVLLRFDVQGEQVLHSSRVLTTNDSSISISPNGYVAFNLRETEGRRSNKLRVVQL